MSEPGFDQLVTIQRPMDGYRDGEGRWTATAWQTIERVYGAVGMVEMAAQQVGAQPGVSFDVAVHVPNDTDVAQGDRLTIPPTRPMLAGEYNVAVVRDVRVHLRVLCERVTR